MIWISGRADGHRRGELTAPDGVIIPYREWWRPHAKAVLLYLHGQGDHSGPFTAMGDRFHELGYNLLAHDHRGFGLSRERRGHITSYEYFVGDTLAMINHAREQNPGVPVFLLGLSMGGHLALRAAARAGEAIAGAIALSPGFKLRKAPPWSTVLRTVMYALLAPQRHLPLTNAEVVTTRNETHLCRARQDEHWVTAFTGRFLVEAVRSIRRARRELRRIRVPVLVMQAGEDYLICPNESRRFFEQIAHPDKEFRLMEGLCHNLVAEPEMPQIAHSISEWMERRIAPV
ncbi:MAG TPA: alpha/beta fold hydrolase [Symbiobacteriaceae bacterium]|nr:alpha/beta fold hydrolase [Symbiobacteriaceae bacterium]